MLLLPSFYRWKTKAWIYIMCPRYPASKCLKINRYYFFKLIFIYLFWLRCARSSLQHVGSSLQHVGSLVAACGLLVATSMWDLVPRPGIEPRPPALGVWSLTHWTTREVPLIDIIDTVIQRNNHHHGRMHCNYWHFTVLWEFWGTISCGQGIREDFVEDMYLRWALKNG